jgi:hypothetical protein
MREQTYVVDRIVPVLLAASVIVASVGVAALEVAAVAPQAEPPQQTDALVDHAAPLAFPIDNVTVSGGFAGTTPVMSVVEQDMDPYALPQDMDPY